MSGPEERIFAWFEYDNDHRPLNRWSEDADADKRDRFGHAEYIRADLHASAIARAEAAEAALAVAEDALQPFAEAAMHLHPATSDDATTLDGIEAGQWRAAYAAISKIAALKGGA